jgi:phasin protein
VPPRCGARTRAGSACQRQAHGGLSPGAPRGVGNGNFRGGDWTGEAIAERKWLRSLVQSFADNGATKMSEMRNSPASVPARDRVPPVRVKLLRRDAYQEQTCPPASEQDTKEWEARLNKALGTLSPDFVRTSLLQLQSAARSPYGTVSEMAINAALAMIEAAAPRDEIEGALAVQMACTHTAAMSVLAKMDSGFGTERRIAAFGSTAARLGERLKKHAEQNVAAVQEYVTKLSQAKTVQDAIQIQTEFMQNQFNAFGEQAKDIAEAYSQAAKSATEAPPT